MTARRALVALALAATSGIGAGACVESRLVPCGELACPADMVCVAARCVTSEQLEACAGRADGETCSVLSAVGTCAAGVCTPVGCGNAKVDPGEACDDGNTAFGDGCSGDCVSRETCGNGIVDYVVGESCDCGASEAERPITCRGINSDDPAADCSASCQLRYCGDGALNSLEPCDRAELAGQTCRDFGFYQGELRCSALCRFDVTACAGRCGDGAIDAAFGEFCDGAAPPMSCVEFGHDAGTIGCSTGCSPDGGRCELFGWRTLGGQRPHALFAYETYVVVVGAAGAPGGAAIVVNGVEDAAPAGTYHVAAGIEGGAAYAVGETAIAVWSGTEWSSLAPGWAPGSPPTAAWADSTLGLYVVVGGEVWRYTSGAWSAQGLANVLGLSGRAGAVHAWTASEVLASTGAAFAQVSLPALGGTIRWYARDGSGQWLATSDGMLHADHQGSWQTVATGHASSRFVVRADGEVVISPSLERVYADGRPSEGLPWPGAPVAGVEVTRSGAIVAAAANGIHRVRTSAWYAHQYIWDSNLLADAVSYNVTPRGSRQIFSGDTCWHANPHQGFDIDWSTPLYGSGCVEASDGARVYLIGQSSPGVHAYDTDANLVELVAGDFGTISVARSGAIVLGGAGVVVRGGLPTHDAGWRVVAVPGYELATIDELSDGTLIGSARRVADGGHILVSISTSDAIVELTGSDASAWWLDLWIAPDDTIFAVGGDTLLRLAPAAPPQTTAFPGAALTSVGGSALDDVFVGGRALPFSTFTGLSHWDGSRWTAVRTVDTQPPHWLHVTPTQVSYAVGRNHYELGRLVWW